jgi:hypothetical protein
MTYQTLQEMNATGIIGILQTNAQAMPYNLFPALIITTIWIVISLGSFYSNVRRLGKGDIWASINAGGFIASIIAGLMLIIPNFMPIRVLVITILLEILCFLGMMTERNLKD